MWSGRRMVRELTERKKIEETAYLGVHSFIYIVHSIVLLQCKTTNKRRYYVCLLFLLLVCTTVFVVGVASTTTSFRFCLLLLALFRGAPPEWCGSK